MNGMSKTPKTKVLFLDVENSPNLSYTWGKYEQNVIDFKKEWYMLSFAYRWLGVGSIGAYSLPDFKLYKKDKTNDIELLKELWKLLDEADIIIGHNLDRFDLRKTNARFLAHGLGVPSPYKTVDTLKVAKKYFFLNSNKLDHVCKYLNIGGKIKTGGFDLWLACMSGDKSAWARMIKYNKNDISLTEKLYEKLKPWIASHPNVNVLTGKKDACPKCASSKVQSRGYVIAGGNKKRKYQCQSCGGWYQGKFEKI